jgi:gluconolactonase
MSNLLFRNRLLLPLLAVPLLAWPSPGQEHKAYPTMGTIIRKDPRFDKLVPKDAKLEVLAGGFLWVEGPVWIRDGGFLLFSDIPNNRIVKWQEGKGADTWLKPSGYTGAKPRRGKPGDEPGTNGLLLDLQGRLLMCEHGDRRVTRLEKMDPQAKKTVLADAYMGKRLNSPNDMAVKSNGDIYFTDPPYGLQKNWDDPARELDFCGVYRISASGGKLTLLTKEMSRPNGIVFSPDEKTLYVANSDPKIPVWMAFDVKTDGTLGKGRVFFDSTPWLGKKGLPDGMKVDQAGNLFATGPGGVHVFTPDGTHLGSIDTGVPTANCAFGNDGTVLYVAADKNLCRIKLSTKGRGF